MRTALNQFKLHMYIADKDVVFRSYEYITVTLVRIFCDDHNDCDTRKYQLSRNIYDLLLSCVEKYFW